MALPNMFRAGTWPFLMMTCLYACTASSIIAIKIHSQFNVSSKHQNTSQQKYAIDVYQRHQTLAGGEVKPAQQCGSSHPNNSVLFLSLAVVVVAPLWFTSSK